MDQRIMFGKRDCGCLKDDGTFITYRDQRHYFIKYHGLAMSTQVLNDIKKRGCKVIKMVYEYSDASQMILTTYPDKFFELGEVYCDKQGDYQRVLRLEQINMSGVHLNRTEQRLLAGDKGGRDKILDGFDG